ncbi:MAG TPA: universal stress protein [Candidatus Binatia bacterium]|jgi:nucleotide-binding universal stress UspA family protein
MNIARKILVPIDFSDDCAEGLKYALSLAQKTQAELIALHVTQKEEADSFLDLLAMMEGAPMLNAPATIPIDRLLREKALDLYRFLEKVIRNPGPVTIRRKVMLGAEVEKILAVAEDEKIDLVVLAVRRKYLFPYLIARGRLLRMISRLPCPVLLKNSSGEPWLRSGLFGPTIFAR